MKSTSAHFMPVQSDFEYLSTSLCVYKSNSLKLEVVGPMRAKGRLLVASMLPLCMCLTIMVFH